MPTIENYKLDERIQKGLITLAERKINHLTINMLTHYYELTTLNPNTAKRFIIEQSKLIPSLMRGFLAVEGLDNTLCYSPTTNKFLLIDPNSEYDDEVISQGKFKIFIKTESTYEWPRGGPDGKGYSKKPLILSNIHDPDKVFPGFVVINGTMDDAFRKNYREAGFDIPKHSKLKK